MMEFRRVRVIDKGRVETDSPRMIAVTPIASTPAEYAVGWFTLSLINAGLAQGKGRSGLSWWLVSLFLGPIATFLIVALDPVRPN